MRSRMPRSGWRSFDLNGRLERVNHALGQVTGFTPERLLEMRLADIVIEQDEQAAASSTERTASECQLVQADGSRGWGLLQRSIVRDANGEPTHVLVQLFDLTSRKQAVVELAAKLDLITVAEGIEDAQAAHLREMRCTVGQGFVLARPEPAAKVAELLVQQQLDQAA
jgi:PAS domain S-box-containing protein